MCIANGFNTKTQSSLCTTKTATLSLYIFYVKIDFMLDVPARTGYLKSLSDAACQSIERLAPSTDACILWTKTKY